MSSNESFYVLVVPQNKGDFRPAVLEYGIDYTKAANKVRWYINDHGLKFKQGGETYPALIQIRKITRALPSDYRVMTVKGVKV